MKILDLYREEFNEQKPIEEGWKENILATVIGVASMFGDLKSQNKLPLQNVNISQKIDQNQTKLDIGKIFGSGEYKFTEQENKILSNELKKLGDEITKNPTGNFSIEINSSESQVTNYDMEPTSDTYKQKLDHGELAKKRAETAMYILNTFINRLKKEGVFSGTVTFSEPKITIGNAKWPLKDKKTGKQIPNTDNIYTKDQFVTANVKLIKNNSNGQSNDNYSGFAEVGEGIYLGNKLIGMIFTPIRQTNDIKSSGNKNTAYQDVLFKIVKQNTPVNGKRDQANVYLKSYLIPWQWWNSNIFNNTISKDKLEYIINNFESK